VGALPTIQKAMSKGAKAVVLMSHLGRPDGNHVPKLTLQPVAKRLSELLNQPVLFLPDSCVGDAVEQACADPPAGSVILLENLRFHPEEEGKGKKHVGGCSGKKCDCESFKPTPEQVEQFRESLAKLGDVYVNDAFGTAHRAHSSMVGMKSKMHCVAGDLVTKELQAFSAVIGEDADRPLTAIVGGAKISDKILVLENLINKADAVIVCGGMAYTFMKECFGMKIGKSLYDKKGAELAPKLIEQAKAKGVKFLLPCDWACGAEFKNDQDIVMVTAEMGIPDDMEGMDCGLESMKLFREQILESKTVVWNGPAGVFEFDNFSRGTKALLDAVVELTQNGGKGIIGGGDSATAAAKWGLEDQVTFCSTGGGASLELLEGKILPGIAALDDN
jgi:phosphoglycerate kinase